jgi:hypothetical protein
MTLIRSNIGSFRRPSAARLLLLLTVAFALGRSSAVAVACPFCTAVKQTFTEEMEAMDVVVLARLVKPAEIPANLQSGQTNQEVAKALFQVTHVIKGETGIAANAKLETLYFGDDDRKSAFLVMGVDPPNLIWSTPLKLSQRAKEYVIKLPSLPKEGGDRLAFFQEYLADEDPILAGDAYDEFARAPYQDVKDLKPKMDHDQLVKWIKDPNVTASRKRLYLTMLGVCGDKQDLPMLEGMIKSSDPVDKSGLDALIACYLTLSGEAGMPLIEDTFLRNANADYADTYAAIMALRFHGNEADIVSRPRVVQGLRLMLDRPQLADLVIPDLARWEDWSQMEKLVQLFKDADDKSSWVRVPVINYLRACPEPEAEKYIAELEKIDPAAVKPAKTNFPVNKK